MQPGYRGLRLVASTLLVAAIGPGGAPAAPPTTVSRGAVPASFAARSYRPGEVATLRIAQRGRVSVELFRAGAGRLGGPLHGVRVGRVLHGSGTLRIRLARWPSGVYFARVTRGRRVGYAPFVLRPRRLGAARVAVIVPTNTWQAYNLLGGASWYANPAVHVVELARPFAGNGLPPHFESYDLGFLTWAARTARRADFLSDDDLDRFASGAQLARLYDLIVFPGHEEYVTAHVYDLAEGYRDLGGNLAFLSSNNFFYKVERDVGALHGRWRWRDLGRPESALIGDQYVDWNHDTYSNRPYLVTGARSAAWLFRGTGLADGDRIPGNFGIEIDARAPTSPPGTQVLARIPDVFGAGKSAEMTYYETSSGAKVFAAGTTNFGGAARQPVVGTMLDNLWKRLSRP